MRSVTLTVLVGTPKPRSRTRAVAMRAAELVAEELDRAGVEVESLAAVDLSELVPRLLVRPGDRADPDPAQVVVTSADLLLVATPTYKASYAGLLKVFFDELPSQALAHVVALPVMTAASSGHRHAVETHLRPLLLELGASVPVRGLCVLESEFGRADEVVRPWVAGAAPVLAAAAERIERSRAGVA